MAMSALKQRLLKIELARLGFREVQYSKEKDALLIDPSGGRLVTVKDDGSIIYYAEHDNLVSNQIKPLADRINELVAAWGIAPAVTVDGLSRYRVLAEYNNIVLCARDDSEKGYGHGFEYVTWRYAHNRTGMENGNYTADYEHAKQDFALRSGLVDRHKLFNETEMKLIYQGLVHLGANFPDLTTEQNTLLGKVVEKIEMLVPEIREREELEHDNLVPEDGLEI